VHADDYWHERRSKTEERIETAVSSELRRPPVCALELVTALGGNQDVFEMVPAHEKTPNAQQTPEEARQRP
jgi:hypothetical protein